MGPMLSPFRAGPGRFITFEGIDGAGKTTQIALLAEHLRANGESVVVTREPGGSAGAELIRSLLVEGDPGRWSAETEILLFAAARRDHVERLVRPALERGDIVLCDRYVDSTRIYQGTVRAELRALVDRVHALAIGLDPDRTLILDLDPEAAVSRGARRGGHETRFEGFGPEFQRRLRHGFLALAAAEPRRCRVIPAGGPVETVAGRVAAAVEEALA